MNPAQGTPEGGGFPPIPGSMSRLWTHPGDTGRAVSGPEPQGSPWSGEPPSLLDPAKLPLLWGPEAVVLPSQLEEWARKVPQDFFSPSS